MIDSYIWGKVERISPEAPVPIISITNKEIRLGGAANVAKNITALGAIPLLCSVVGEDHDGNSLRVLLENQMKKPKMCWTGSRASWATRWDPSTASSRIAIAGVA